MTAVIIEDEEMIADLLQQKIAKTGEDITILHVLHSLKSARKWFASNPVPDFMFMDIQLGDGLSFDLLSELDIACPIIFTTAYDEYALKAFSVNGIDYLLKPIKDEELLRSIQKTKKMIEHKTTLPIDVAALMKALTNPASSGRYKEKIIVSIRNQWMPVNTKDIACFSREALNYVYLHSGERYSTDYETLDELEAILDPQQFFRANRQFIINIDAMHVAKSLDNGKLLILLKAPNNNLVIEMSRLKNPEFRKWIDR